MGTRIQGCRCLAACPFPKLKLAKGLEEIDGSSQTLVLEMAVNTQKEEKPRLDRDAGYNSQGFAASVVFINYKTELSDGTKRVCYLLPHLFNNHWLMSDSFVSKTQILSAVTFKLMTKTKKFKGTL